MVHIPVVISCFISLAGAFQYIDITGQAPRIPLSYQILYNNYSIIWKYPIPRSLTRIYIAPTPSLSSEETSNQEFYVQYLEASCKRFSTYARFKVVVNRDEILKIDFLDLPPAKPVSDVWRIVHEDYLDDFCNENDRFENHSRKQGAPGLGNVEDDKGPLADSQSLVAVTNAKLSEPDKSSRNHCNMTLLLGSIRVDSFYSPKLISNLHVFLQNKEFQVNFLYSPTDKIAYKLNRRKLIFNKFVLNQKNVELFENNDYIVAQMISNDNRVKYNFNANFSSGLYLSKISTGTFNINLINYNLLELKPLLEVIRPSVKLYNAEYRNDENRVNVDLMVRNHVKLSLSHDLVNSASLVRKLANRTLNQLALLNYREKVKDLREQKTDIDEPVENKLTDLNETVMKSNDNALSDKHMVKVPHTSNTDVDKSFDKIERKAKPIQIATKDLKLNQDHETVHQKIAGLTILDLNELTDPFYGGTTSGFSNNPKPSERKCGEINCTACSNTKTFHSTNADSVKDNMSQNSKETFSSEDTLKIEPSEEDSICDLNTEDMALDPLEVDVALTSVMICNNTHIPFIMRQYDTAQEAVVYR